MHTISHMFQKTKKLTFTRNIVYTTPNTSHSAVIETLLQCVVGIGFL